MKQLTSINVVAETMRPRDLHFRKECADYTCGAGVTWNEGFEAGAKWALQRAIEVVNDYKDELVKDMDNQEHWDTFSIEILDTATTKIDEIQK